MNNPDSIRNRVLVRLKHKETGKYLYSIDAHYSHRGSSMQQLVGTVRDPDDDCIWFFSQGPSESIPAPLGAVFSSGTTVRVQHTKTAKNLHSHAGYRSPTSNQQEVTTFGCLGYGDSNDGWELRIVDNVSNELQVRLKHITAAHLQSHANNFAHAKAKPESGEVTALAAEESPNSIWIVEPISNSDPIKQQDPVASIQPSKDKPAIEFFHLDVLNEWITAERNQWGWLSGFQPSPQIRQHFATAYDSILTTANQLRSNVDQPNFSDLAQAFERTVKDIYGSGRILFSGNRDGTFILKLSQTDSTEAGFAAGFLCNVDFPVTSTATRGIFRAEFFKQNLLETVSSEKKALQEATTLWEQRLAEINRATAAQLAETNKALTEATKERETFKQISEKLLSEKEAAFENLEKARRSEVDLRVSRTYWNRKAISHFRTAWIVGLISLGLAIAAGAFIKTEFDRLFMLPEIESTETKKQIPTLTSPSTNPSPAISNNQKGSQSEAKDNNSTESKDKRPPIEYWRYLLIAIYVTFSIWLIRISVRIALGNLHQHEDAKERVTMIDTFLALVSEGRILQETDSQLIFTTLFRPGVTGLIDADSGPATPMEVILKGFKSGGD